MEEKNDQLETVKSPPTGSASPEVFYAESGPSDNKKGEEKNEVRQSRSRWRAQKWILLREMENTMGLSLDRVKSQKQAS